MWYRHDLSNYGHYQPNLYQLDHSMSRLRLDEQFGPTHEATEMTSMVGLDRAWHQVSQLPRGKPPGAYIHRNDIYID